MTTIILDGGHRSWWNGSDLLHALRSAWQRRAERRALRAALAQVRHLGPRLLADMGLEHEAAMRTGWDTLRPNGLLVVPRR